MSNNIITTINPPSLLLALSECQILFKIPKFLLEVDVMEVEKGDGHPVLVLPGFTGNDFITKPLRDFLKRANYKTEGWKLGFNLGYSEETFESLSKVLLGIYHYHNQKISLVGWSLGGVFARELAKVYPNIVRNVVTLGSPFVDILHGTNIKWLYRLINIIFNHSETEVNVEILQNLNQPPPVPTSSLYSKLDGIVSWECCLNDCTREDVENIDVDCHHIGFIFNPRVLRILANRLSQSEDNWKPYQ